MAGSKFGKSLKVGSPSKGFNLRISGVDRIIRNLQLTKNQNARLKRFLEAEARKIVATAKQIVPVDTERLKDSHRVLSGYTERSDKTMVRVDIVVGGISVRGRFVNYAAAVHEGYTHARSGKQYPARPWLATALEANRPGYMARLKKAIKIHGR